MKTEEKNDSQEENQGFHINTWESKPIYPLGEEGTLSDVIFKAAKNSKAGLSDSNIERRQGRVPHPLNVGKLIDLQLYNEHHASCLNAKVNCCVGLGFKGDAEKERERLQQSIEDAILASQKKIVSAEDKGINEEQLEKALSSITSPFFEPSKVDDVLDPLCEYSFADLLFTVCMDFEHGDGYIEVVRKNGKITGLYHLPAAHTYRYNETSDSGLFHYCITASASEGSGDEKHFPKFGDKAAFIQRHRGNSTLIKDWNMAEELKEDEISEVIHFRMPNNISRYYGHADWVSAIAKIELSKVVTQYKYDFYNNRGVAEFLLFFTGGKIGKKDWETIISNLNCNLSSGNKRKSSALNIEQHDIKIQLEKLGSEKTEDTFQQDSEAIATMIVTGHRVPPLLANILIPGKLGATNELPNALKAFQLLNIDPRQRVFMRTLVSTLGNPKLNGGLGLVARDFTLRKITDLIDLNTMDTVARMRQTLPDAQAEGRDVKDGLKD